MHHVTIIPKYLISELVALNCIDDGRSMVSSLIGSYPLLEMFNLYPENTPKEFSNERIGRMLVEGSLT